MLRSQSLYINEMERVMYYMYGIAEEKAKQLAAEEAEDAALAAIKPQQSLDRQPTRTDSNQSSV